MNMAFRTDSQVILAANMAQDLTNLVVAYLELYRKHAQGLNGIHIPTGKFRVVFRSITEEGRLPVKLLHTQETTWDEPIYYDVDSDYFSESLGASNISGYVTKSEIHTVESDLTIPVPLLLQTREQMELSVQEFAERKRAEMREQKRLAEIAKHEAAIRELRDDGKKPHSSAAG